MTIALAIWLIFKCLFLTLSALIFAALGIGCGIGAMLAVDDGSHPALAPSLLGISLYFLCWEIAFIALLARMIIA
jgi:hypothetical protein